MELEVIFRRSGYEYRYRIGMDEEMLSSYRAQLGSSVVGVRSRRRYILEVRTNFILKKSSSSDDEEIIESERFADIHMVDSDYYEYLKGSGLDEVGVCRLSIDYRLEEYWLPKKEIERIVVEAMCLVKRTAENAYLKDVFPVVVYLDVCTVQLEGELLDSTLLRLIKPDRMIPFQVWGQKAQPISGSFMFDVYTPMNVSHRMWLLKLPRERVEEDVDIALARMETCPICFQAPTYGTRLTPLPCQQVVYKHCGVPRDHVFHNHCIVRWLMNNNTCPVCHSEVALNLLTLSQEN